MLKASPSIDDVATHRYRDFPFLFTPCWWQWFTERAGRPEARAERPHRDRIEIDRESPDAFEEPLWQHFFPFVHDPAVSHVLTPEHANPAFDAFFADHLRKILLLRDKRRYVSKGNYNLTRLEYLSGLFPDARFVIPVRHPVAHVDSLVRQHALFSAYAGDDARVPEYLRAAGHYEFGPQRVPVNVDAEVTRRVLDAWQAGDDRLGYALLWQAVYAYVRRAAETPALEGRVAFVRYEDLCADACATLDRLIRFAGFDAEAEAVLAALPPIEAPPGRASTAASAEADVVWQVTCSTAECFGYTRYLAVPEARCGAP